MTRVQLRGQAEEVSRAPTLVPERTQHGPEGTAKQNGSSDTDSETTHRSVGTGKLLAAPSGWEPVGASGIASKNLKLGR